MKKKKKICKGRKKNITERRKGGAVSPFTLLNEVREDKIKKEHRNRWRPAIIRS